MKKTNKADKVLLDTNVVVALFAGEPTVLTRIQAAEEVYLPVTALGELYHGAFGSTRQQENIARLETFAQRVAVLHNDEEIAKRYGEIKARLTARGKLIPENDIWIAATAVQYDLTLLSRDIHFRAVDQLRTEAARTH